MYKREVEINGTPLSFETGKYAKQADGSVIVRMGDSVVLVTACAAANAARRHRLPSADGRLQGIHLRVGTHPRRLLQARRQADREGSADQPLHRPAHPAAVPCRLALRVADHRARAVGRFANYDTDVLAISGASAALALSGIPFKKTIASVRVGQVDGQFIINPTYEQRKKSRLDLIIAGTKDGLVMVEAGAKEVPEEEMVQALEAGHAAIKRIVETIDALAKEGGKTKRTRRQERNTTPPSTAKWKRR